MIARIALIVSLILIGSGCATTAHLDIQEEAKPTLPTITAEQQEAIEEQTWLILQEREATLKAFANKLIKKIRQHNEQSKDG